MLFRSPSMLRTPPPTPPPTSRPTPPPTRVPTAVPETPSPTTLSPTMSPTPPLTFAPSAVNVTDCQNNFIETCLCGDEIKVSFSNCKPEPEDWVGLYACKNESNPTYNYHPTIWLWTCYDAKCQTGEEMYASTLVFNNTLPVYTEFGPHEWPLPPGCYVAVLNRNYGLSPPPYDIVIEGSEFYV